MTQQYSYQITHILNFMAFDSSPTFIL